MNAISDPGRPSRRDRRRAQKLVDTAFAERRLTAADRTLRMQRIQAAHTRGDLAMITRDLVAPVQTNLGRALDSVGGNAPTGGAGIPTIDLSGIGRRLRLFVLIAVAGVFASCVLGLVAFIPAVISGFNRAVNVGVSEGPGSAVEPSGDSSSGQIVERAAASLHTAAGWSELVDAVEAESGTTRVYDLVVYPEYASVGLDGKDAVERRLYRNGGWQESFTARTPIHGSPVDLGQIDPQTIARLPGQTAQQVGIDDPTGVYFVVNAFNDTPQIAVYVQSDGESRYRAYRLDGAAIS